MYIPYFMFFFGAVSLWGARRVRADIVAGRDWPTRPGRILERGVGAPMGTRGRNYLPHVKYTYEVGGQQYTNDQVYLIRGTGGGADAMRALVDRLPDPVPVHVDPADPSRSYLLVNPMGTVWLLFAFGVGATVLGAMLFLVEAMR